MLVSVFNKTVSGEQTCRQEDGEEDNFQFSYYTAGYSQRSACIGSTRIARRAGMALAISATHPNKSSTTQKVMGSAPLTPASSVPVNRAAASAMPAPRHTPSPT